MDRENLLYVLTTARCPLSCSFCMTKHLHRNEDLVLNDKALQSLVNLSKVSKKVCLSGEGDPLASWQSLVKIIKNSPHQIHYELITSSYWNRNRTESFLIKISELCKQTNSSLVYRISIDEFHEKEIKRDVLDILIRIFADNAFNNINLQIRSITGQEDYVFNRLTNNLKSKNISFEIDKINQIEYVIKTKIFVIKIQFKPTVKPASFNYKDEWTIDKYLLYLEEKRKSNFHIGLLNSSWKNPKFDITINPNGDLVLYGLEPFILGNITREIFTYELITKRIEKNDKLKYLIQNRFYDLITAWSKNERKKSVIENVNNPFWIVRYLYDENLLEG